MHAFVVISLMASAADSRSRKTALEGKMKEGCYQIIIFMNHTG